MAPEHEPDTHVAWDGARNLADLGGLPLVDGGTTVQGRVWRSAAPEWMTDAGWHVALADGLTCIIDLRNDAELGRRPEHPVVGEQVMGEADPGSTTRAHGHRTHVAIPRGSPMSSLRSRPRRAPS